MKVTSLVILIFIFLVSCGNTKSFTHNEDVPPPQIVRPERVTADGFFGALYMTHGNYVTSFDRIEYKFTNISASEREFTYRYLLPSYIDKEDTLIFRIDFETLRKSFYIQKDFFVSYEKYDSVIKKDDRKVSLRIDTFSLVYIDSIQVLYGNAIFPIYRFDSFTGDSECNTFFVNDSIGIFKRYSDNRNLNVEHEFASGTDKDRLQIFLVTELGKRKDFHHACPVTKLWTGGDKFPNQKK